MQIRYFVPRCTPENSHGRYVIELALRFAESGRVTVYSGDFWPGLIPIVDCRLLPIPNRPAVARLATLWAASVVSGMRSAPDIVHIQGADAPHGNVFTAHCCNAAMAEAEIGSVRLGRRFNYSMGAALERYVYSRPSVRTVIAVSQKIKEELESRYKIESEKMVTIPPGVDSTTFHPGLRDSLGKSVRARLGIRTDDFVVLHIGGDSALKGLPTVIRAARRLPSNVKVLAVGDRPGREFLRLVGLLGMDERVRLVEKTMQIEQYYSAADCFVLPTHYDTFSLSTLEALACGLPVIVGRAAGITELLVHRRDCLILERSDDSEALSGYILLLLEDSRIRGSLSLQGRDIAEGHSWDEVARRTMMVYEKASG